MRLPHIPASYFGVVLGLAIPRKYLSVRFRQKFMNGGDDLSAFADGRRHALDGTGAASMRSIRYFDIEAARLALRTISQTFSTWPAR